MFAALLTYFAVGLVGLVALGVFVLLISIAVSASLSLAGFLLFKVVPIVLIGYLLVRLLSPRQYRARLTAAEREWLEGP